MPDASCAGRLICVVRPECHDQRYFQGWQRGCACNGYALLYVLANGPQDEDPYSGKLAVCDALVAVLGYFKEAGYRYLVLITPLLLIGVLWALLYPWLHRQYLLQTSDKLLKESSYQKAFGVYTLNLSEARIASSCPIGEGTYIWSAVSRVSLTPDYLFIFLAGPQGYPIARAQVPEDTIQEMKAFVEEMSGRAEPAAAPNDGASVKLVGSQTTGGPSSVS